MDWEKLIAERDEWVAHNFPMKGPEYANEVSFHTVFGVVEEMGELTHAHLKQAQSIRGSDAKHIDDAQDAIGDLTIYLLGVMSYVGPPRATPIMQLVDTDRTLQQLGRACGNLLINPAVYNVETIVYLCKKYCDFREWDYEGIVEETWNNVKQRDWILYPDTGMPPHLPRAVDPLCTCAEDREGGDPNDHSATCEWAQSQR